MDVLTVFRALVPEFSSKTDDEVNTMIELAKPHVSASRFGSFYAQAVANYAAHLFAMQGLIAETGGAGVTGIVTKEKVGDIEKEYASPANVDYNNPLDRTIYGQEFQALARKCIVPGLTRMR